MTARTNAALSASEPAAALRAYGLQLSDLDLRLDDPDRPAAITAVLACCGPAAPGASPAARLADAWSLTLGDRILRLLRIVALTDNASVLAVTLRCPQAACLQPFELALPFAEIFALAGPAHPEGKVVPFPRAGAAPLALRLPTGHDQAAWQREAYATPEHAVAAIVQSLLPSGEAVAPAEIAPIAAALEAADPLVAFTVSTACPHCETACALPIDLEAAGLERLAAHRRSILHDVHLFATHYGWNERDVLAVSPRRRADYRRLLATAENTRS